MFKIITDSTAYFTRSEAKNLGITIVPMTFSIKDKRFIEGYSGEQKEHFIEIEKNLPYCKTSQPNLKIFFDAFTHVIKNNNEPALCITMSSRLSGAFNSATVASAEVSNGNIKIFDSLSIAGGEKMIVEKAVELSNQGKTIDEAIHILTEFRNQIKVLFSVSDMEALRRSGRIGFVKQSISNILNIVPLLRLKNGAIESITNARGMYNFLKRVKTYIPKNISKVIVMAFENDKAKLISEYLLRNYSDLKEVDCLQPGAILAIHLGNKSFGIAWQE
jgi:DegV family protein with EDD domain